MKSDLFEWNAIIGKVCERNANNICIKHKPT